MASARGTWKMIRGLALGLTQYGNLASKNDGRNVRQLSDPIANAVITIGAENANVRAITVQLKDHNGNNIDYAADFEIGLYVDATMTDFVATGGSTGLAAGATGKLLAVVAKKLFRAISSTSGAWAGTYTDTGTDPGYLAVKLPNGRKVGGGLITNAP